MTRTFGGVAEVVVEAFDGAATSSAVLDRILDSAGGTRVVLPVPGGASTTSGPRSGMCGRSSAAGKPSPMVARSNGGEDIGMIVSTVPAGEGLRTLFNREFGSAGKVY